jgi:2-dehydropantoate 2-reductase
MACLFAARLSAAGAPVILLGTWREALDRLRREGVCLVEADTCEQVYPVLATDDPRDCAGVQIALVLVKSWQTGRAARQLAECLAPGGLALTLQNGMGNREVLANALGEERVALGVTTLGANLMEPGRVRPAGDGTIHLEAHPRLEPLVDLLRAAGLAVEIVPDPKALLWGKLVINAAINPLTALLEVPNGELLERPSARLLMAEIACEAAAAAGALGIRLPYPDPAAAAEAVALRTAANRSSMLQDVQRGAPTEIDAICGAIVKTGEQVGVPVPVNHTLWKLVKARTEKKETTHPRELTLIKTD